MAGDHDENPVFLCPFIQCSPLCRRKKRIILKTWRRHGNDEKKRNLFEELVQGIEEINQHLEGKITLKYTDSLTAPP
jgi:hypothetical protein